MAQVSDSGLSKSAVTLLAVAMAMKNKNSQAAAATAASTNTMLNNVSLGAGMPSIGYGLSGLANGAMMSGLPGVGSSGFSGGLADRLGISQFFPQGFNPFSGSATSELASMGTSVSQMTPFLAASATAVPSSPAQSANKGTLAALALLLTQKSKSSKTDDAPAT